MLIYKVQLLDAMGGHADMTSYAELRLEVNFLVFQVGIPKCGGNLCFVIVRRQSFCMIQVPCLEDHLP